MKPQSRGVISFLLTTVLSSNFTVSIAATTKLDGTSWKLSTWSETIPLGDAPITAAFSDKGLNGFSGCNQYRTQYQTDGNSIKINNDIATTRKMCPDSIMKRENRYLETLQGVGKYEINAKGELKIFYRATGGQGIMTFTASDRTSVDVSQRTPAPEASQAWLDRKLANWNKSGATLPKPPNSPDIDSRCQKQIRKPTTPEDKAITRAGWKLFGTVQLYSGTSVVKAMSGVDGMCRPMGYQDFVFVDGTFAGTLSPTAMDARTEGSLREVSITDESNLTAQFNRYSGTDALCCPSRTSWVSYRIERKNGKPIVVPLEVTTQANSE